MSGQGQVDPGTCVKKMDSVLLVSSSDGCSGLRWPAVSLGRDVVSSVCTVESEQMGGSGTKGRRCRERPSRPSMAIVGFTGESLAFGSTSSICDSNVSSEGDSVVVSGG